MSLSNSLLLNWFGTKVNMKGMNLDSDIVVTHRHARVTVPTDVHGRVGAMLDLTFRTSMGVILWLIKSILQRVCWTYDTYNAWWQHQKYYISQGQGGDWSQSECLSQDLDFPPNRCYWNCLGSYLQKRGVILPRRKFCKLLYNLV